MKKRTLLYAAVLLIAIPCLAGEDAKEFISMVAGAKFILIPAGSFMMGSPNDEPNRESDETQHHVIISRHFHMQTTVVTQGQWKTVMGNNRRISTLAGTTAPWKNFLVRCPGIYPETQPAGRDGQVQASHGGGVGICGAGGDDNTL